jgi:ADP-heptose:LPS heptosyltransferase
MLERTIKFIETRSKRIFERIVIQFLPNPKRDKLPLNEIRKVLVFRLDERIGNGIMLLPLITAIRYSINSPDVHVLIHQPVAELLSSVTNDLISKIWGYNQPHLMKRPWKMIYLFLKLRREHYDVIITSHNPDNFSFSQALLGRWCNAKRLVGFNWKNSASFYDVAVTADLTKHYANSMLDLWREFDESTRFPNTKLEIPVENRSFISEKYPQAKKGGVLLWLGAGKGGQKAIPNLMVEHIYNLVKRNGDLPIMIAAGPNEDKLLGSYSKIIKEQTTIWSESLINTAAFFSFFQIFVSGDTGPLHLAVALNLYSLGIFFHTDIQRYGYNDDERHFSILINKYGDDYKLLDGSLLKMVGKK